MAGPLHTRLLSALPTRRETWTFGLGSLLPFTLLAAARVALAHAGEAPPALDDLWKIQVGDWELWAAWGWIWWLGHRLFGRFAPRAFALVFHAASASVCLYSALELAYWHTTGSRSDWEMLAYGFRDVARVWPVVSSELSPAHWGALVALLGVCLAPFARRPADGPSVGPALLWALALVPIAVIETTGRPRVASAVRPLQSSAFDTLFWDGLDRWGEVVIPAAPDTLVPLEVRPVEGVRRPNVVVVFLESVGALATTPYSPLLPTTPTLDRLAREGLVVENLTAVVPHTSKALVTTLCGDWPYLRADVREARPGGLPGPCLPHLLDAVGYRSAFFQPARGDFEDRTGLAHEMGFDVFRARALIEAPGFEETNYFGIDDRAMIEPGVAWSAEAGDQPFFATYLTLTSHHDYVVPAHWPEKALPGAVGRRGEYLAAVRYVDDFLGRLVEAYAAAGLLDDTVFVILGDHGEAFGEHDRSQHDLVLWEEGVRVPGILWGPGVLGRTGRIEGDRQQIDILPTVLGLTGLEVVGGATRGRDLLAPVEPRALYHACWRGMRCLARREGDRKVIDLFRDGPIRAYDLAKDPTERTSLTDDPTLPAVRDELRAWRGRVLGRYEALFARWRDAVQVPDTTPAVATWGGRVSLRGCAPERPTALPGETIWVNCLWRAENLLDEAIRVTTHLRAGGATESATWVPGGGELPVWEWKPGHAVSDVVRVTVPADAPAGPATLDVGWATYSGDDLTLPDGSVRWTVATLTVVEPPPRTPGPGAMPPVEAVVAD